MRENERIHHVVDATIRLIESAELTMEASTAVKDAARRTKEASSLDVKPVLSTIERIRRTTARGFHTTSIVRGTTGNS